MLQIHEPRQNAQGSRKGILQMTGQRTCVAIFGQDSTSACCCYGPARSFPRAQTAEDLSAVFHLPWFQPPHRQPGLPLPCSPGSPLNPAAIGPILAKECGLQQLR